jgi:hypothetical protein
LFSQQKKFSYIQINATVDLLDNITMRSISKSDSLLAPDYKKLNEIILNEKRAINVINLLSNEGWVFVSVVHISKDDEGMPNTPFLAYYFVKQKE